MATQRPASIKCKVLHSSRIFCEEMEQPVAISFQRLLFVLGPFHVQGRCASPRHYDFILLKPYMCLSHMKHMEGSTRSPSCNIMRVKACTFSWTCVMLWVDGLQRHLRVTMHRNAATVLRDLWWPHTPCYGGALTGGSPPPSTRCSRGWTAISAVAPATAQYLMHAGYMLSFNSQVLQSGCISIANGFHP